MKLPGGLFAQETAVSRQARLAALSAATVLFSAAAGLEAQLHSTPLLAVVPGALAFGVIAARALPSPAWSDPLVLDVDFEIRESPGRGEGLFALQAIEAGTFVMDYLGEDLDQEALDARYGTEQRADSAPTAYLLELNSVFGLEPTYVDAVDPQRSNPARYMNHNGGASNLRKVKQRFPTRRLRFYAKKDIAVDEELTWDYGASYWVGREGELL